MGLLTIPRCTFPRGCSALLSSAPHVPAASLKRAARRNWAARNRAAGDRDQTREPLDVSVPCSYSIFVRLSVWLSCAVIVTERNKLRSRGLHHTPSYCFRRRKVQLDIRMESPRSTGYQSGWPGESSAL